MSETPEPQKTEQSQIEQPQQPPQRKLGIVHWILLVFGLLAALSIGITRPLELVVHLVIISLALWLVLARKSPLRLLPNVHQVAFIVTIFIVFLIGSWIVTIYAFGPFERLHPQTPWLYLASFGLAFAYFGIPLQDQIPAKEEVPQSTQKSRSADKNSKKHS